MDNLKPIIEALILASDAPLSLEKIGSVLHEVEKGQILEALQELVSEYEEKRGGIILQEVAGGYQFRTRPDLSIWIKRLKGGKSSLMSPAAMETLAIVAYRQPVVKAEIDKIRGVDAGGPLKKLLDRKMVRIVGRKDVPGKPILYGTTRKFLEVFNLKDLTELPTLQEMKELHEESPAFQEMNELQEELPGLLEAREPREELPELREEEESREETPELREEESREETPELREEEEPREDTPELREEEESREETPELREAEEPREETSGIQEAEEPREETPELREEEEPREG